VALLHGGNPLTHELNVFLGHRLIILESA